MSPSLVTYTRYPTFGEAATGVEAEPGETDVRVANAAASKRREPPYRPTGVVIYDVCGRGNGKSLVAVVVAVAAAVLDEPAFATVAAGAVSSRAGVATGIDALAFCGLAVGELLAIVASSKTKSNSFVGVEAAALGKLDAAGVPKLEAAALGKLEAADVPKFEAADVPKLEAAGVSKFDAADVPKLEAAGVPKLDAAESAGAAPNVNAFDAALCRLFQLSRAVSPTLRNEFAVC